MQCVPSCFQDMGNEAAQKLVVIEVHQRHTCIATLATQRHQQHRSEGSEGLHCLQLGGLNRSSMPTACSASPLFGVYLQMWAIDET